MTPPRSFHVGDRVRASLPIYYAIENLEIPEGCEGTVEQTSHGGFVAHVKWAGFGPASTIPTTFTVLELVASATEGHIEESPRHA